MAATFEFSIVHQNCSLVKHSKACVLYFFRQTENWEKITWIWTVTLWLRGTLLNMATYRHVYTAVYLSKGNTFQKLTGKNGHVDTLVGYNFQKEKSLPASFKPQEILWVMLTFWKLDPV